MSSEDVLLNGIKSIVETLLVLSDSVMENHPEDTDTLERLDFLLVEALLLAQQHGFDAFTSQLSEARWRCRDRRASP